jgi:hypothetical protein
MPRSALLAFAAFLTVAGIADAQEIVSPIYKSWAQHKVGTIVTYREVTAKDGVKVEATRTLKLAELSDVKAVIDEEEVTVVKGKPETVSSMSLTYRKMFPLLPGMKKEDADSPPGIGAHGEETIKAAGKEYKAHYYEAKSMTDHGPAIARTWISNEVPGKVIKSVTTVESAKKVITLELIEIKVP